MTRSSKKDDSNKQTKRKPIQNSESTQSLNENSKKHQKVVECVISNIKIEKGDSSDEVSNESPKHIQNDDVIVIAGQNQSKNPRKSLRQNSKISIMVESESDNNSDDQDEVITEKEPFQRISLNKIHDELKNFFVSGRIVFVSNTNIQKKFNLFSVRIRDENGDINIQCSNLESNYEFFKLDEIIRINNPVIHKAGDTDSKISENKYRINLNEENFHAVKVDQDITNYPKWEFINFRPLQSIKKLIKKNLKDNFDIIGIVEHLEGSSKSIQQKNGVYLTLYEFTIVDDSQFKIKVTIWNKLAELISTRLKQSSVIALKELQLNEFNEKCLSSTVLTEFVIDPICSRSTELNQWFEKNKQINFKPII